MRNFDYHQPTKIKFGPHRIEEVGKKAKDYGKNCLVVSGSTFNSQSSVYKKVEKSLKEEGLKVSHFDKVVPNPTTETVTKGAEVAKTNSCDMVLGLGGGSSMDTAKAIAVEVTHKGKAWDYLFFRDSQPGAHTLPILTITTTSGTGSHVTQVAVVTNPEEKSKSALFNPFLYPKLSIVDPELMVTLPQHVTASTGFDAFAHAFESYINPNGSPYTDMMALESINIISKYLPLALEDGKNIKTRYWMAWADTLSGLCIANAGVTLPHGIGMAVGGNYPHVMHGESLAVVYPSIMNLSYKADIKKFATIGRILDKELKKENDHKAAQKSVEAVKKFIKHIGMETSLEKLNIPENELENLARDSLVLPDYKNHPLNITIDHVRNILKESYKVQG